MTWKLDSLVAASWLQRARPEGPASSSARSEPGPSEALGSSDPRLGWDPYDVWLRHIHEPRRRRDAEQR